MKPIQNNMVANNPFGQESNSFKNESSIKDDTKTWKLFKNGSESAFIFIYKTYANTLFNYGSKFSPDRELVKDCLQDFFVYLRKNRETLGDTDSIKLYLLKSFRRRVLEYVNKHEKERLRKLYFSTFSLQIEQSDEMKFINIQDQDEMKSKLNKAIDQLPDTEKEAIFYFFYEGLTYKDIAEILNFTHISSARRMIYRSLKKLKDYIVLVFALILHF